jgi:hypothetical protein
MIGSTPAGLIFILGAGARCDHSVLVALTKVLMTTNLGR